MRSADQADRRVVVLGGGITGLSAAFYLARARPDLELLLLERGPRLGGNIRTERQDGFVIDAGPDSFVRTKPHGVTLCKDLGLDGELIVPSSRRVYVAHRGMLELLPEGLVLGAPTRLLPLARTRLLSLKGKLRALGRSGGACRSVEWRRIDRLVSHPAHRPRGRAAHRGPAARRNLRRRRRRAQHSLDLSPAGRARTARRPDPRPAAPSRVRATARSFPCEPAWGG